MEMAPSGATATAPLVADLPLSRRRKKTAACLRCELCDEPVVRHHCDLCGTVTFFERKIDDRFYCERCEEEMVVPQFCSSPDCNGALTILKWNKVACKFHCLQCDTLRIDILRTVPDVSSFSHRGYILSTFPSRPSLPVKRSTTLLTCPPLPMKRSTKKRVSETLFEFTCNSSGRPKDVIPEFCLKPHVPYVELDPSFHATKSDSGFGPSKPNQEPDEQLPLVRTKQRKRRRR